MTGEAVPYWHVDAFAARPFAGNQAAVMLLDAWLPDPVLQAIAEENRFAETAFAVPDASGEADWELSWFTPACEVRLCGHATLASGHVLLGRSGGARVSFRTRKAGVLEVRRLDEGGYELALPGGHFLPGRDAAGQIAHIHEAIDVAIVLRVAGRRRLTRERSRMDGRKLPCRKAVAPPEQLDWGGHRSSPWALKREKMPAPDSGARARCCRSTPAVLWEKVCGSRGGRWQPMRGVRAASTSPSGC